LGSTITVISGVDPEISPPATARSDNAATDEGYLVKAQSSGGERVSNIPAPVRSFTGRQAELNDLEERLKVAGRAALGVLSMRVDARIEGQAAGMGLSWCSWWSTAKTSRAT
jgi:hypothetical protein